jgi:hypothetical protein
VRPHSLIWVLLACPSLLAGQDEGRATPWVLGLGSDVLRFSGGVRDTVSPSETGVTLRPNGRLGIWAALAREFSSWNLALELGWARGHIVGSNSVVSIEDRTADVNRYRIAPTAGIRLLGMGSGRIEMAGGPTFDRWTLGGEDRWRIGGQARLAIRVPLGGLELENRVSFGISRCPITGSDAGEEFDSGSLRVLSFGVGLRYRL